MKPSRVWYQVNPPDPSDNFCAPSRKSTRALERLRWPLAKILGVGEGVHWLLRAGPAGGRAPVLRNQMTP